MSETFEKKNFGIYIHLPYCLQKCPYCDFNSYAVGSVSSTGVSASAILPAEDDYVAALVEEIQLRSELFLDQSKLACRLEQHCSSIFFGGGTPSLCKVESIEKLLVALKSKFKFSSNCEITLETNPGTVSEELGFEKLCGFKAAGINRISIGAQSFNPETLKFLGRIHDPEDTTKALTACRRAGFKNINLDLIFGSAGQTLESWQTDLETAIALNPEHLSAYSLTIESNTEFGVRSKRGEVLTGDEDLHADLFEYTQEALAQAGYPQYEISNYARPGFQCVHNLNYWKRVPYLGLGAGAHGFLASEIRYSNIKAPKIYLERIRQGLLPEQMREELSDRQQQIELIYLALRLEEGLSRDCLERNFAASSRDKLLQILEEFAQHRVVDRSDPARFKLTRGGMRLADRIIQDLVSTLL
ncbi:radical SAM family heme chaperone HemW [bacterium]|nr:radical SAM family heme chaperone HemW [bacterium]